MTMSGRRLSVVLAGVLLMGVLVALGITQATAQSELNSQPSTSKYAADARGERVEATALKTVLWAVVNPDGTLARGRGALAASRADAPTGAYEVLFDRNVRRCSYTATIGLSGASGVSPPGEITVVGRSGAPNGVFITTHDSTGALADRGFHLTANCPAGR